MLLPEAFITSLRGAPGFDEAAFTAVHDSGAQVTSIRLNPAKIIEQQLQELPGTAEKIPWCANGYYLPQRPIFTLDPLLHGGAYYVQEASSMFLEEVMKQTCDLKQPLKVLDLCAAPGGKSTLLQSVLSSDSLLVSNEVIKTRVNILAENITKWGAANVVVTNNEPYHFQRLENYFDVIVVDAPCSGSGLFRKDPDAIKEWSPHNVEMCGQRQQKILNDIMPSLNKNGILVYATCSYSSAEDEDILRWLAENFELKNLRLHLEQSWQVIETIANGNYGYRFYPDKVKGEGFFIAAFQKKMPAEEFNRTSKNKDQKKSAKVSAGEIDILRPFIKNTAHFSFHRSGDEIIALPATLNDDLPVLQSALYIKKAGTRLGAIIRNELVPAHELALGSVVSNQVQAIEVDKDVALQYLRKEEIKLDSVLKGWALIKYRGVSLGWIKILANRCNNYYPKEWRILMK